MCLENLEAKAKQLRLVVNFIKQPTRNCSWSQVAQDQVTFLLVNLK